MSQEELFEVSKTPKLDSTAGEYIKTNFKWKAPNHFIDLRCPKEQFHQNIEEAEKYMDAVVSCIKIFELLIKERGQSYDPMHIAATQLSNIEAWTCPITFLSKLSIKEAAVRLYDGFDNRFKKDKEELEELIKKRETEFYSLNIKEEERLNELNKRLNYGLSDDFLKYKGTMLLDNARAAAERALKEIKFENYSSVDDIIKDLDKTNEGTK